MFLFHKPQILQAELKHCNFSTIGHLIKNIDNLILLFFINPTIFCIYGASSFICQNYIRDKYQNYIRDKTLGKQNLCEIFMLMGFLKYF